MRYFLLIVLLFSGCTHTVVSDGQPKQAGQSFLLATGTSMYPILVVGDEYTVNGTHWDELEPGMIVKRWHVGRVLVHKLGNETLRGRYDTYGINNGYIDPIPMSKDDFIGEVILN